MSNINDILLRDLTDAEIKELQQQYPYFSYLQKLLAKRNFHPTTEPFADKEVVKAAVLVANRDKLKQYLYDIEIAFEENITPITAIDEIEEKLHVTEEIAAIDEAEGNNIVTEINETEVFIPENNESLSEAEALAIIAESKNEIETSAFDAENNTSVFETILDEEIKIETAIEYIEKHQDEFQEILEVKNEEASENAATAIQEDFTNTHTPFVYEAAETADDTIVKHTFDEWFSFIEKRKAQAKQTFIEELEHSRKQDEPKQKPDELDDLINHNVSVAMFEETLKQETSYAKGLDSFIEEQKKKKENVKKSSVGSTIVSETYADLLIKQGKIDKAIETFRQLILKYPEKNSYFADRIEKLKK